MTPTSRTPLQRDIDDPGHRDLFHIPPAAGGSHSRGRLLRRQLARPAAEGDSLTSCSPSWPPGSASASRGTSRLTGRGCRTTSCSPSRLARLVGAAARRGGGDELAHRQPPPADGVVLPADRRAHEDRRRGHDVPVRQLRGAQPGGVSTASIPTRRSSASAPTRSSPTSSRRRRLASPSCCSAASTTSPANCSTSRRSPLPATPPARSSAGTSPTPPATCRLQLHDWDVDFAAWCSYKYLNAGPGAVAGAFVHERHLGAPATAAVRGLVEHRAGDALRDGRRWPAPPATADAWQISNPPILAMGPVRTSLELFDKVGIDALARAQRAAHRVTWSRCSTSVARPLEIVTPRDPERRGAQLSVRVAGAAERRPAAARTSTA